MVYFLAGKLGTWVSDNSLDLFAEHYSDLPIKIKTSLTEHKFDKSF